MSAPVLPAQWQASYVSWWSPQRAGDRLTSGYCWFDYLRGVSRIDGFLNPWDDVATGHHRWVSEVHWFAAGLRVRRPVSYQPSTTGFEVEVLEDERSDSHEPALPRSVLADATRQPDLEVMGRRCTRWATNRAGRSIVLALCTSTGVPVRLTTEKTPGHFSHRDFIVPTVGPIDAAVFGAPPT